MAALLYFRGDPRLPPKTRASVYIDGFNFYYGALRGSPHKWLNLERFCQLPRPADELQAIGAGTGRSDGIASLASVPLEGLARMCLGSVVGYVRGSAVASKKPPGPVIWARPGE